MWWMLFPRWIWFVLGHFLLLFVHRQSVRGMTLQGVANSHAGICPNDMNPNLWVDAMSTCKRECQTDQECEPLEKCCANVCGSRSCVAARYIDTTGKKGPMGMPKEASCDQFMCTQQGSECDIRDGQPVCKCRDRCEREPQFTCASDGMTYYNKCYMDAEACSKGISLSVVSCRFHLSWPNPSPLPSGTTALPTTALQITTPVQMQAPVILSSPTQQSASIGDTVSFLCDVVGHPVPEITWQKQSESVHMKPNQVYGNVVVTNIGQLVIYNAQVQDSGIYTCTAANAGGSVQANFPLSVSKPEAVVQVNASAVPVDECFKAPDSDDCGEEKLSWFFDPQRNSCNTFTYRNCSSNRNHFDDYESCMSSCLLNISASCMLPIHKGPCKAYELRWAYSSTLHQCRLFIYGGCKANENNFKSKRSCEDACPYPKNHQCKACKPRYKMVSSFCRSDFVILGRMVDLTEDQDSGRALVMVEEILKDEKMGLKFLGSELLEVTLQNMDWSCPCPNVTTSDEQIIFMGDVHNGMAVLQPDSFIVVSSVRRVQKLREVVSKNTCDILKEFVQS
ncbi:WAP, Kazal, immunoglobulin, Kunitz and NTR domain-containing protein 2 isoform X1 [Danio rerio]|uniref:WAP, Kazal, immunoglobulin, Kunitz and NTR domain-containing protein 2 isoform X1 n=2 Tax=Danio rerio TaxID=7955 RepID=UPI0000548E48|nr:WAP, Kazal, immunoglobulin, Kunitz and NTR domain-containing protein 2 [Danio rerio]|eukprot:XP_699239.1 WAP, Kazal, immunoglobulin, Kunitz and NTR domain-containing protein 2 [Danio rerio]